MSTLITTNIQGVQNIKYDASTTAMTIDSSGRVTKSLIPSFVAKHNQSIASSQTPVVFNIATLNIGSHYDTSTGVFTCPIAGLYYFSTFGIFGQNNGAAYGDYKIQQNGNDVAKGHFNNPSDVRWEQVHVSVIVSCSANDAIRVVFIPSNGTPDFYQDYNAFQGYLIG